jgi:hypothetical protein
VDQVRQLRTRRTTATRNTTAALLEAQKNVTRLEAQKLALAEEAVTFNRGSLGRLNANTYMEYLEWADAEKTKRTEVRLENKYQGGWLC